MLSSVQACFKKQHAIKRHAETLNPIRIYKEKSARLLLCLENKRPPNRDLYAAAIWFTQPQCKDLDSAYESGGACLFTLPLCAIAIAHTSQSSNGKGCSKTWLNQLKAFSEHVDHQNLEPVARPQSRWLSLFRNPVARTRFVRSTSQSRSVEQASDVEDSTHLLRFQQD